jgi:hypothetical protein
MDDDLLDGFVTLFRGRADAYGSWEGGCVREPLTRTVFERHLHAGPHIGVYCSVPVRDIPHTVWGCVDIDYDAPDEAWLLADTLASVGVDSWVEQTRKGWHIWVFADRLVPSDNMRRMLLAAHQVCGLTPKEVNPKQAQLAGKGLGNYVRLPYHAHYTDTPPVERRIQLRNDGPMRFDMFITDAIGRRVDADTIAELADYYQPPAPPTPVTSAPTQDMTQAAKALTPLGRTIFREGPRFNRDRSTTLAHLAHECVRSGLAYGDALVLMEDADSRWGKFSMRGETGLAELAKLVQRVYGHIPAT